MSLNRTLHRVISSVSVIALLGMVLMLGGCSRQRAKIDEPVRYTSIDKLRERLQDVSKYGLAGSSLGGIPESIEELTKSDPAKGKELLADFQRLNTADDVEARKQIAKEMMEKL